MSSLLTACTALKSASDEIRAAQPSMQSDEEKDDAATSDSGPDDQDQGDAGVDAGAAQDDAGNTLGDCWDPDGFSGLGCHRCAAQNSVDLENACSDSSCRPFDNRLRLRRLPPQIGLPDLPQATATSDAGSPSSADAAAPAVPSGDAGIRSCSEIAAWGKPVYITGSSAAKPFLQQVARQLASRGVYLIYTSTGSCVGVDAIVNGTPMTTGAAPAPATSATYWSTPASDGEGCALSKEGVVADLGISDVFSQSCPGFEVANLDTRIRDVHGPIQTMAFVVPTSSMQNEISAQAAYFVYGFGKDGEVLDESGTRSVWTDETRILQRQVTSGTQAMLAAAIGVPAGRWKGKQHRTSDELAATLLAAGNDPQTADQTLGILGVDYIDSKNLRAQARVLAFQDTNQSCAVYPDSTQSSHDRRNVRDGHYPLWGPLHLLHRVNADQLPANADTRQELSDVLGYLAGSKALPNGVKLIDVYAQSGLIPECAMNVTRSMDGGNITPVRPTNPCSCLFEERTTGNTDCAPCKVQGDCTANTTCSNNYCEP